MDEAAIAARAYELCQERACPIGSPETDWLRAEEDLRKRTLDANPFTDLHAEADQNRIKFLQTELATCFTFITVVETERNLGNHEHAERTLADAEKAYATIQQFLADPKYSTHFSDEERRELREGCLRFARSWRSKAIREQRPHVYAASKHRRSGSDCDCRSEGPDRRSQ